MQLFDHCLAPDTLGDGTGCDNMTAVIVQFKSSKVAESDAAANECVMKKRPVSPTIPDEEENKDCTAGEDTIKPCKRAKTEAAM